MPALDPILQKYAEPPESARAKVYRAAERANLPEPIADDFLNVAQLESGAGHYDRSGRVRLSPVDPKDGQRAVGFSQIKPGTARKYNLDPYDEDQNIEAGLREFASAGDDPVARRISYFAGSHSGALKSYQRTGQIPKGGDFTGTSFTKYVNGTMPRQAQDPILQKYAEPPEPATPAVDPILQKYAEGTQPDNQPEVPTTDSTLRRPQPTIDLETSNRTRSTAGEFSPTEYATVRRGPRTQNIPSADINQVPAVPPQPATAANNPQRVASAALPPVANRVRDTQPAIPADIPLRGRPGTAQDALNQARQQTPQLTPNDRFEAERLRRMMPGLRSVPASASGQQRDMSARAFEQQDEETMAEDLAARLFDGRLPPEAQTIFNNAWAGVRSVGRVAEGALNVGGHRTPLDKGADWLMQNVPGLNLPQANRVLGRALQIASDHAEQSTPAGVSRMSPRLAGVVGEHPVDETVGAAARLLPQLPVLEAGTEAIGPTATFALQGGLEGANESPEQGLRGAVLGGLQGEMLRRSADAPTGIVSRAQQGLGQAVGAGGLTAAEMQAQGRPVAAQPVVSSALQQGVFGAMTPHSESRVPERAAVEGVAAEDYVPDVPVRTPEGVRVVKRNVGTPTLETTDSSVPPQAEAAGTSRETSVGVPATTSETPEATEPEHHSARQQRRARNTETGKRGQFKAGPLAPEVSNEAPQAQPPDVSAPDMQTGPQVEAVGGQVGAEVAPTARQTRQRAKTEKVNSGTGLTPTQTEYLANELVGVADQHVAEAVGAGAKPAAEIRQAGISRDMLAGEMQEPVTIKVPGDGEFTIKSAQAANRLHQKITGQPIEGFERAKNATVPRGTPQRATRGQANTDIDTVIDAYGGEQQALDRLQGHLRELDANPDVADELGGNRYRVEGLVDELKGRLADRQSLAEYEARLPQLEAELEGLAKLKGRARSKQAIQAKTDELSDTRQAIRQLKTVLPPERAPQPDVSRETQQAQTPVVSEQPSAEAPEPAKSTLQTKADEARARIAETKRKMATGELEFRNAGPLPGHIAHHLNDYIIIGAAHIENGVRDFAAWSKQMVSDLGEDVRPYLKDIYAKSQDEVSGANETEQTTATAEPVRAGSSTAVPDTQVVEPTGTKNAEGKVRERAFPQSLEQSGITGARDKFYNEITDEASRQTAEKRIQAQGADEATKDILSRDTLSKDDLSVGVQLLREAVAHGDTETEGKLADHLSRKLTEAGQTVQGAKMLQHITPEAALIAAGRRLPVGQKLTTEQRETIKQSATETQTAQQDVDQQQAKIEQAETKARAEAAEQAQAELDRRDARIAELEEQQAKAKANDSVQQMQRESMRERRGRRAQTKEQLQKEFSDLLSKFGAKASRPHANPLADPELYSLVGKMARNRVQAGITTIDGIIDELHTALKEHVDNLTKRDVMEAVSNYGQTAELSQEPVTKLLRERRAQMRLILAIEDAEAGQRPPPQGLQRGVEPLETKALRQQLNDELAKQGLKGEPIDKTKTRVRQEIKDLEEQTKTGNFEQPKSRNRNRSDAELDSLRKQRTQLQAKVNKLSTQGPPKPPSIMQEVSDRAGPDDVLRAGAQKLASRPDITRQQFNAEMADEHGLSGRALNNAFRDSYKLVQEARQGLKLKSQEATIRRQNPTADDAEVQRLKQELLAKQTRLRKAQAGLKRDFDNLTRTNWQRAGRQLQNVKGIITSLKTGFAPLHSGFRHGFFMLGRHPVDWMRSMVDGMRSLSTAQYDQLVSELQLKPDYKYAEKFKLGLTTPKAGASLVGQDELFQSDWANEIPIIKQNHHAFAMSLDQMRMRWFESQMNSLRAQGYDPDNPAHAKIFQDVTNLINDATMRSSFGAKGDRIAADLNNIFFTPRGAVSRIKMAVLPARIGVSALAEKAGFNLPDSVRMSRPARVEAFKTLAGFTGMVGGILGLGALAGGKLENGYKISFGNFHLDPTAGVGSNYKLMVDLAQAVHGQKDKRGQVKAAGDVLLRYLRTKEGPAFKPVHDILLSDKKRDPRTGQTVGTDFVGQPVYAFGRPRSGVVGRLRSSALVEPVIPMIAEDAVQGIQAAGGAAAVLGAAVSKEVGLGGEAYKQRRKSGGDGVVRLP